MKKTGTGTFIPETGIYVVCSDKALLDSINRILSGSGVIGMQDREGRMHYVVDARSDKSTAVLAVNKMVTGKEREDESGDDGIRQFVQLESDAVLDEVIREVMLFYGFDISHFGTQSIMTLVKHSLRGRQFETVGAKEMFEYIARLRKAQSYQVERNVRYAVRKSRLSEAGLKSVTLITLLSDAVRKELERRHKKESP